MRPNREHESHSEEARSPEVHDREGPGWAPSMDRTPERPADERRRREQEEEREALVPRVLVRRLSASEGPPVLVGCLRESTGHARRPGLRVA